MIGKRLGNRFEIIEKLGGGGMAVVYKGRDTLLHRLVTIKVLRSEFASDEEFVKSFRREAQAIASLSHPNIVNIHDVGQEDHIQYLVMEYVDGDNLKNLIKNMGALSSAQAIQVAVQVCAALEHAHDNNIVHRDVKPHNILITNNGKAKLTDFGIATETTAATMTHTDTIVGSVHYLSPEQAQGEEAGSKSDIYSLGVVLYEMLTGTLPFTGDNPISIALKHIKDIPVPLKNIKPDLSSKLQEIVLTSMSKKPEQRQSSARELARQLQAVDAASFGPIDDLEATLVIPTSDFNTMVISAVKSKAANATDTVVAVTDLENGPPTQKKHRMRPIAWVAVLLVLVGLAFGGSLAFRNFLIGEEITVPDVTNKDYATAKSILEQKGLKVMTINKYDNKVPEGKVISQNIGPNNPPVKKNQDRQVLLVISNGPEMKPVPYLIGKDRQEISMLLNNVGLVMTENSPVFSKIEKDKVAEQSPEANKSVPIGSKVTVAFSKGPEIIMHDMPDLTGKKLEEAKNSLQQLKLDPSSGITRQSSDIFFTDQVISQTPAVGTKLQEGTAVTLIVSDGPGPAPKDATVTFEVPDDSKEHNVKIQVIDIRGTKEPYLSVHVGGDKVSKSIRYYGKATIIVYIDDVKIYEKAME